MSTKNARRWPTLRDEVPMRHKRDVMTFKRGTTSAKHFAPYPLGLPDEFIRAFTRPGDTVLDPFSGSGTTGIAAVNNNRAYIGIDCSAEYNAVARARIADEAQAGLL